MKKSSVDKQYIKWTPKNIARLSKQISDGLTARQASKLWGITRRAMITRALMHDLHFTGKPGRPKNA